MAIAPYGSWASPIAIELLTSGTVTLGAVDCSEDGVYWLEGRAQEDGRSVVVFRRDGEEPVDVVPAGFNVRSRVHEYGGGAYCRHGETIFCSSFDDGRLYRFDAPGAEPSPITPEPDTPSALRYADGRVTADGRLLICVRERHGDGEPVNELVVLPTDGSAEPSAIASGRDFYSSPRVSPGGARLAWTTWDHPRMPFEGTELRVADLGDDGSLSGERLVAGSSSEAIVQPEWSADGVLHFASDRSGWWNLYAERGEEVVALHPAEAEFAFPPWVFGLARYAFLGNGRIACIVGRRGTDSLEVLDPRAGTLEPLDLPYTAFPASTLCSHGDRIVFVGSSPTEYSAVVTHDVARRTTELVRCGLSVQLDRAYVSVPEAIEFPGADGETAHAFYYPPTNPDFTAPEGELPPLIVDVHGGPTAQSFAALALPFQFFTSRGFAIADVNYGGSTGYGRAYRERLDHRWGEVDVEDCVAAAEHLAGTGKVDPARMVITGGSAGGYTTLMAMARRDAFAAGISEFGVVDLVTFHGDTHKFEARYDELLVGRWPEEEELYRERSPITYADGIARPLLLLQGLDDEIVPPSQSEQIVEGLARRGVPHAYLAFEGEGHGFRRADTIRRVLEAELSFLAQLFGFEPADEVDPLAIASLDGAPH